MVKERPAFVPLALSNEPLLEGTKNVSVRVCRRCGRVARHKRWLKLDLTEELKKLVEESIVVNKQAKQVHMKAHVQVVDKKGLATVDVDGKMHGEKIYEEATVPFTICYEQCNLCIKNVESYYEGVLQLRNLPDSAVDDALTYARQMEDRGVFVNKILRMPRGADLYISNQKIVKSMAIYLQKRYGGRIQNDAKLFTYDHLTSKDVFRVNVTLTAFTFGTNDIITDGMNTYIVQTIGVTSQIVNIRTNEIEKIDAQAAKKFELLLPELVEVIRLIPHVSVLHPKTYQEIPLLQTTGKLDVGSRVFAAVLDDRAYFKHI
jgi:NMD protein affecting ribosome stability and mRNA decay